MLDADDDRPSDLEIATKVLEQEEQLAGLRETVGALSDEIEGVRAWFRDEPWDGDPDPGSFGGHPYSDNEREIGYGTYRDPRFLPAALARLRGSQD
jgi:hypothetical protein